MSKEKRAAGMFFTDGSHALILKRNDKYWDLPGGRIDDDETYLAGAQREVKEEIGLLPAYQRVGYIDIKEKHNTHRVYVCFVSNRFEVKLSKEHKDYKWCDLDKLEKKVLNPGLLEILDELVKMSQKKIKVNENNMNGFAMFFNENADLLRIIRQFKQNLRKRPGDRSTRLMLADALDELGDAEQAEIQRLMAQRRFIIPMDADFIRRHLYQNAYDFARTGSKINQIIRRSSNGLSIYNGRELEVILLSLAREENFYDSEMGNPDLHITVQDLEEIRHYLDIVINYVSILQRHS